ncbi:uncharacterized protein LOC130691671 [Daphnia carinata]|uniref:uncharacterized protein LOC130691671 n=1 Tax=Daphnia carinata TaxID=120202 RepID=UPI00257E9617|nr:uncharacterized protein LOC130691671 [Daphnia carinata]
MKSKIALVLLFAVAAQAQFIGGYHGYAVPSTIPVQWLSHGQFAPSNVYAYTAQPSNYYRDIAGNNIGSWAYFNPTVQVDANAVQPGTIVDPKSSAAPVRAKRQIQLRYRGGGRNGRSLNDRSLSERPAHKVATPARKERQIQLRYRGSSRRGRSIPLFPAFDKLGATSTRADRQIILRYRNGANRKRVGRSLNEPSFIETMPAH